MCNLRKSGKLKLGKPLTCYRAEDLKKKKVPNVFSAPKAVRTIEMKLKQNFSQNKTL